MYEAKAYFKGLSFFEHEDDVVTEAYEMVNMLGEYTFCFSFLNLTVGIPKLEYF